MVLIKIASNIGELSRSSDYQLHLNKVQQAILKQPSQLLNKSTLDEDPEYQLILQSNSIIQQIDDEILATHKYVSDIYSKKFPELENLILNKIDYIKTVQVIGNEMDLTLVDLTGILPSATIMIVAVTGSTTSGAPLNSTDLKECFRGCDEILKLDTEKTQILSFIESRMSRIAPNLSVLVGAHIAAQLVGLAGGLLPLSMIPSCNIQVMGQEKKLLVGLSSTSIMPHTGILNYCEMVQSSPPNLKKKMLKIVSAKVALAARVDAYQNDSDSTEGRKLKADIESKIEKFQEPAKARTKKALPIPEEKKRNKRGGKRVRKQKERFEVTALRKLQNKLIVTVTDGEYGDSAMGFDNGAVGSKDTGKIRAPIRKEMSVLTNKKMKKAVTASSGQTNGLSSSLVFTPVQGLELINPNAAAERVKAANNKWFNSQTGFLSAKPT